MYFRFNAKPLNTDNMFLKIPQIVSSFPNIRENRVYFCKYHCRNSQLFFFDERWSYKNEETFWALRYAYFISLGYISKTMYKTEE